MYFHLKPCIVVFRNNHILANSTPQLCTTSYIKPDITCMNEECVSVIILTIFIKMTCKHGRAVDFFATTPTSLPQTEETYKCSQCESTASTVSSHMNHLPHCASTEALCGHRDTAATLSSHNARHVHPLSLPPRTSWALPDTNLFPTRSKQPVDDLFSGHHAQTVT